MRPRQRRIAFARAACAAGLVAFLWSAPAAAQGREDRAALEKARGLLGELRYDDALATLSAQLEAGKSGPAATAQIYLLLGEVRASVGQETEAERAFQLALAIDARIELRKGLSPKIARPFRRARRAQRAVKPIAIAHRVVTQDPPTIAVLVQSDPLGLVAGARITYWEGATARSVAEAAGTSRDRIDLVLPRRASRFVIAGIDRHGNRVVELGSQKRPLSLDIDSGGKRPVADVPAASEPVASEPEPAASASNRPVFEEEDRSEADRPPLYAHWILWGGVAVGLAAAGTWAGLSANSAVDELDQIRETEFEVEFSEAKRVADRAEQRSLIANVCFGAAGVSAVAATILFFRGRRSSGERPTALAPMIGHDHVGVSAALRF
jgi:hypothetical protein